MSKDTQVHVQLGPELHARMRIAVEKDAVVRTDAAFVRQAIIDLLDKRDQAQQAKDDAAAKREWGARTKRS